MSILCVSALIIHFITSWIIRSRTKSSMTDMCAPAGKFRFLTRKAVLVQIIKILLEPLSKKYNKM